MSHFGLVRVSAALLMGFAMDGARVDKECELLPLVAAH